MLILLDMDKRILIIEDEPDIREAMAEAITQEGYEALTAENGLVGLELALAERPDIILLDIIMPVMDGHEMLAKLRIHPWGKSVKVIMLTSMDDVKNIGMAHEGSITDYIIKAHSSLDEIVNKVKMAIYT